MLCRGGARQQRATAEYQQSLRREQEYQKQTRGGLQLLQAWNVARASANAFQWTVDTLNIIFIKTNTKQTKKENNRSQ